jgi:hypothetical protein
MRFKMCSKCGAIIQGAVEVKGKGPYVSYLCKKCFDAEKEIKEVIVKGMKA